MYEGKSSRPTILFLVGSLSLFRDLRSFNTLSSFSHLILVRLDWGKDPSSKLPPSPTDLSLPILQSSFHSGKF